MYDWQPYVPVAKRREQAKRKIKQLQEKGLVVKPIEIEGRKITKTFWGNAWCQHIERFSDYENRLPRGRTYVRNGSVCHLDIKEGTITAIVSGSSLYDVEIEMSLLPKQQWADIKKSCSGQIGSLLELLQGKISDNIMTIVMDEQSGLFPELGAMKFYCNCPDRANMCKHIAAVLYGIGARLDDKPGLLFEFRGVDHNELIDTDIQLLPKQDTSHSVVGDLSDIFGITLEDSTSTESFDSSPISRKPTSSQSSRPTEKEKKPKKSPKAKKQVPFRLTSASVKRLRKSFDMNLSQFAQLVQVSPTTISSWEKRGGKLNILPESEKRLLKASKMTKNKAWKRIDYE